MIAVDDCNNRYYVRRKTSYVRLLRALTDIDWGIGSQRRISEKDRNSRTYVRGAQKGIYICGDILQLRAGGGTVMRSTRSLRTMICMSEILCLDCAAQDCGLPERGKATKCRYYIAEIRNWKISRNVTDEEDT